MLCSLSYLPFYSSHQCLLRFLRLYPFILLRVQTVVLCFVAFGETSAGSSALFQVDMTEMTDMTLLGAFTHHMKWHCGKSLPVEVFLVELNSGNSGCANAQALLVFLFSYIYVSLQMFSAILTHIFSTD